MQINDLPEHYERTNGWGGKPSLFWWDSVGYRIAKLSYPTVKPIGSMYDSFPRIDLYGIVANEN
jgi:hypothetical protein